MMSNIQPTVQNNELEPSPFHEELEDAQDLIDYRAAKSEGGATMSLTQLKQEIEVSV